MAVQGIILKKGREKSLLRKHQWIFSGAIFSMPEFEDGEILPVYDCDGGFLATAYFHRTNSIAGRVLSFEQEGVEKILSQRISEAYEMRKQLFDPSVTNAFRVINAEGDCLPGLIVDKYSDLLVIQINTCGMQRLKPLIIECLVRILRPKAIYEKSISSARRQEGLQDEQGYVWGEEIKEVTVLENGMTFLISIEQGQKTGFFLDQRNMREWIGEHALNKKVLNCFSYTGGFSLYALKGGASRVDSVDICANALAYSEKNTLLNGFELDRHRMIREDVFDFLKHSPMDYGLVILDPPAFAKKRGDVNSACMGYKEINRLALQKIPSKSLLLTSSCSYFIDESLFQNLLFQAACEAGRSVKIISRHRQASDHPISLYHPEGEYLKSLFLYIS
jgi:23S rRNA (cytosine1962-C5)-methyltransferase